MNGHTVRLTSLGGLCFQGQRNISGGGRWDPDANAHTRTQWVAKSFPADNFGTGFPLGLRVRYRGPGGLHWIGALSRSSGGLFLCGLKRCYDDAEEGIHRLHASHWESRGFASHHPHLMVPFLTNIDRYPIFILWNCRDSARLLTEAGDGTIVFSNHRRIIYWTSSSQENRVSPREVLIQKYISIYGLSWKTRNYRYCHYISHPTCTQSQNT